MNRYDMSAHSSICNIGNIEAIGFLLAAKSIFRFGDLNKAKVKTNRVLIWGARKFYHCVDSCFLLNTF